MNVYIKWAFLVLAFVVIPLEVFKLATGGGSFLLFISWIVTGSLFATGIIERANGVKR